MFVNPGGPGDTGVGLVQGDPDGVDALGGGRFDVVSWDPRGTNASTRVRCFENSEARRASGPASRSRPPRPTRSAIGASPPPWRGAAARSAAGFCPTSRPPTPPATSTTCASSSARRSSPTSASPTAPSWARPTPTCSPTGSGRCCSTASSIRSRTRRAPRRGSPTASPRPTRSSTSSCRCARARGRSAARSPVARQTAAERVRAAGRAVKRAPIPAPGAKPPLSSPEKLSYADLLLSQFNPLRAPDCGPRTRGTSPPPSEATDRRSRPRPPASSRRPASPARRPRRRSRAPTRPRAGARGTGRR